MWLCSPRGDDVSFIVIPIGVDHRNFDAVDEPNRINPDFAVLKAIIDPFHGGAFEYPHCICERDGVPTDVGKILVLIPSEPQGHR
jgi:hypothetical protein